MSFVPLAAYRPDVANLNSEYAADVVGALRAAGFYIPFPQLEPFTSAVATQPVGGITAEDADGGKHFFVGTASKLYKLNTSTLAWEHVSKLASDTIVNGVFAADTDWSKGAGWTIAAGVATATAASGTTLTQSQSLTAGKVYKFVFTVSGYSAGAVQARFGGGTAVLGTSRTANGTYTEYLTAVTGNTSVGFITTGSTTLNIDNVTLQEQTDYTATVDERWRFKQFGNYVVAVNINDTPQVYELNVSSVFANLGGSPPNARHIAIWGDHLALFNDRTASWSDTDDITNWSTLNAGSQVFPDGGNIAGSTDATNPIIFQKSAIRFAQFVPGSSEVFTFTKIHDRRGCAAPYSIASRGEFTFFADAGGFFQITLGGQILPIGKEKVDRTVFSEIEGDSLAAIYGEVDPFHSRVYWAVRVDSTNDNFDRIYVYDWDVGEFSRIDASTGILFPLGAGTIGYTLDGLDSISSSIDALEFSLDSNVWKGGSPVMAAFDSDFKLGFFAGPNAEATFTTQEIGNTAGQLTMVSSLYPVIDNDNAKVKIGTRMFRGTRVPNGDGVTNNVVYTAELSPSTVTGRVDKISTSRFHRFVIRVPAGEVWSTAQGIDIESQPAGYR